MRVVVVMSTFRGARFVREQLRSIIEQLPPDGRILVRDDGSDDDTPGIVADMAATEPRISLSRQQNVGFARSFFLLLDSVPDDCEMVMLADQDDVWLPDKINRAWNVINGEDPGAVLYCSRLHLVDAELRPIGLSPCWPRPASFANAVTENIVTGCTAAMNRAALALVRRVGDTRLVHFHDWWMYLVVSAFGKVVYDPQPTILYRQHGGNALGMGAGLGRYLAIIRFVRRHSWVRIMFDQLENFRATHGAALTPSQSELLDSRFNPHSKLSIGRLVLAPAWQRQYLLGELLLRAMIVFELVRQRGALASKHSDYP